jgi:hypothetical protein
MPMITARVLMLCTVMAVIACHRDAGTQALPAPKPRVSVPVVAGPNAEELTAGMVEAASQGKSQAPVKLKFELRERPTLGQTLDINLAVIPQIDASPAGIEIAGGNGLVLPSGSNQFDLPAVEAGQVYRQSVKVTPSVDGVLLLSLTILLKHDEITESRMFSIPLIVDR